MQHAEFLLCGQFRFRMYHIPPFGAVQHFRHLVMRRLHKIPEYARRNKYKHDILKYYVDFCQQFAVNFEQERPPVHDLSSSVERKRLYSFVTYSCRPDCNDMPKATKAEITSLRARGVNAVDMMSCVIEEHASVDAGIEPAMDEDDYISVRNDYATPDEERSYSSSRMHTPPPSHPRNISMSRNDGMITPPSRVPTAVHSKRPRPQHAGDCSHQSSARQ